MPFLDWVGEWWTVLVLGLLVVVSLLYVPVYFHRKRPHEAYVSLFLAEFGFPELILTDTPVKQLLSLPWMAAIWLLILLLTSTTMYSYARTMRAIEHGKNETIQDVDGED